ncbi:hypothetical protein GF351_00900 [Candidatus Woesearchaeota archaeon]|nr:hypothetical protein [Candidatus Woesearchaeota archaeon]
MVSAAIATALFPVYGWWSGLALVGGWAVDFDHYMFYVLFFRDLDPLNALRYFKGTDRIMPTFCLFHTVEFIALVTVVSFISIPLFIFSLSLVIHVFLDIFYDWRIAKSGLERFSVLVYGISIFLAVSRKNR